MKGGIIRVGTPRGLEFGFTEDLFDKDSSYLWMEPKKGRVMVSLIFCKQEGKGHFSALVKAIEAKGYRVAVPTPMSRMTDILTRWGFVPHVEDAGEMGPCEVWERPTPTPPAEKGGAE